MVKEVRFLFDTNNNNEQFELTFAKEINNGEWELVENDLNNFFASSRCARDAFVNAYETLEELNK